MAVITALFAFIVLPSSSANAQDVSDKNSDIKTVPASVVNVFVGDYLDPHNESLIKDTLKRAVKDGRTLYIIQLDSHGVAGANVESVANILSASQITTAVWVGPASARYSSELDPILASVDIVGAASDSLKGKTDATIKASSLREFIAELDGKEISRLGLSLDAGCSQKEIQQAKDGDSCYGIETADDEQFTLNTPIKFEKLSPISNLAHALINPSFAIGILVLGLCLLAFEYFAASVGVASLAGIGASIAGIYGLGYLPVAWWAVGLIVFGIFAMVVDVQAGGTGLYTIIGSVSLVVGSIFATERGGDYQVSFIAVGLILIMALLFMMGAIPSLIRTRFGTPTIGREEFIGLTGVADGDIDPDGSIKLRGASWKARTNHATPIKDGEECKVTKIEGIILEVEPLVGAAKDYREKR